MNTPETHEPAASLVALGFDSAFQAHFQPFAQAGLAPARVIGEHPGRWRIASWRAGRLEERLAVPAGRLRHAAAARGDLPAVGDWVAVDWPDDGDAVVQAVLPRRSKFSRAQVGDPASEQIVAANVDVALVVALNGDFNLRRLERYVATAWDGGATPVVVLSKADLAADLAGQMAAATAAAPGAEVVVVSVLGEPGLAGLSPHLRLGRTVALLGSSGAGKSTLTNALLGQARQATQAVRTGDDRGRHTTTTRELILAPSGVLLLDTPGMRELGRFEAGEGLGRLFADVAALAEACRFRDCGHAGEPGCAIGQAIAEGALDPERYQSFVKLQREEAYQVRRVDKRAALAEKARWKQIHLQARSRTRG